MNLQGSVAGPAQTGRACPYCHFPLKQGVAVRTCPVCDATHHAECWRDNGGCAIVACGGGPTRGPVGGAAETSTAPQLVAADVYPKHGVTPIPPPRLGRRGPSLAIAVIVLALAVGGAAVAIVLSGQRGNTIVPANTVTIATTVSTPVTGPAEGSRAPSGSASSNGTTAPSGEGALPGVTGEQMRSEIQQMLLAWHEDVLRGDYRAAWTLLSRRKQAQDEREYGYGTWIKNQSTLRPYLDPANLQVVVESTEPVSGVAQVDVTGMRWGKPGAPCTEWSGITWVKYEDGGWKYDPGYSTTPQRERRWKHRFSELLGGRC